MDCYILVLEIFPFLEEQEIDDTDNWQNRQREYAASAATHLHNQKTGK